MELYVGSKPCIACAEEILIAAKMCKYCKTLQSDPRYLDNLSSLENRLGANSAPVEIDEVRIKAAEENGSASIQVEPIQQRVGPQVQFFEGEKSSPKNGLLVSVGLGLAILFSMAIVLSSSTPESANPQVDRWADVDWGNTQGGITENTDAVQDFDVSEKIQQSERLPEETSDDPADSESTSPAKAIWVPTVAAIKACWLEDSFDDPCGQDYENYLTSAVEGKSTFGVNAQELVQRMITSGMCKDWPKENKVWERPTIENACLGENTGGLYVATGDAEIWRFIQGGDIGESYAVGQGWVVTGSSLEVMQTVADLMGGIAFRVGVECPEGNCRPILESGRK